MIFDSHTSASSHINNLRIKLMHKASDTWILDDWQHLANDDESESVSYIYIYAYATWSIRL